MTFNIALFVPSVDPALGRLDYGSLPQQALMEIVVSQMSEANQKKFKDENGNFKDLGEWEGVKMNGTIQRIRWWTPEEDTKRDNQGKILLEWLPSSSISNRGFAGELDCTKLPRKFREFYVGNNRLSGNVDFTRLPALMAKLNVDENSLRAKYAFAA